MNENEQNEGIKGLLSSLKDMKGGFIFLALFILGILLVVFSGEKKTEAPQIQTPTFDEAAYTAELETRLTAILSGIDGIGYVQVMVTLENVHTNVYAEDSSYHSSQTSQESESTLTFYTDKSSGTYPIKLTETMPTVRGVAVVCKNGGNADIQLKVTNLLTSLLGVPSNRIYVTR